MIGELFSIPALAVLLPAAAAGLLAAWPAAGWHGWLAPAVAGGTLLLAATLPFRPTTGALLLVDGLAAHTALLTALVGCAAAWHARLSDEWRAAPPHHDAMLLAMLAAMLAALLSNNLGIAWAAMEVVTIVGAIATASARTPGAVGAARKYLLLCGSGIALALVGIVVLYAAAASATGPGLPAMTWSTLLGAAPRLDGPLLNLAFVLLVVGYGTKAALAPLHSWMPDAHAEGPNAISAVLSGSVLNVAMITILRLRGLLVETPGALPPGPILMGMGALSVVLGGFGLWRQDDAKRFFALSTLGQNGVVAIAIGLGGPLATFAGLLHMAMHTLTKAAILQCVGTALARAGGARVADVAAALAADRALAVTLLVGVLALLALPPAGLFVSTVLTVSDAVRQAPPVGAALVVGLAVGGWGLLARLLAWRVLARPAATGPAIRRGTLALAPAWVLIGIVVIVGVFMPSAYADWLRAIAGALR